MTPSRGARVRAPTLSTSRRVLLLVDFINPLRFEGAEAIAPQAVEAARATAAFKRRCRGDGWTAVLVITGLAADYCVQSTAMDAYVRGHRVWVPSDCTGAESLQQKELALQWMREHLKARVAPTHRERRSAK